MVGTSFCAHEDLGIGGKKRLPTLPIEYLKEHPNLTVIKTLCDLQLEQNEGLNMN